MTTYNNTFSSNPIFVAFPAFALVNLTSSITLNWPTQFQNVNQVVANSMNFNATVAACIVSLPDATQGSPGYASLFTNIGTQSFTVADNLGDPLLTLGVGLSYYIELINNTTVAGNWQIIPFAGGGPAVFSVNAVSSTPDITVTGGPITTSGTFTFNVGADLLSLTSFGASTGFAARTATNTWALRSLAGTANQINILNPQGIAGNPTFSLNSTITGINSLTSGNLMITGNTISAINLNGNVNLSPQTTGPTIGEVVSSSNISIHSGNGLKLFNPPNTDFLEIIAGNRTTNFTYTMPTVDPVITQVLQCSSVSTGVAILDWANIPTFSGASTPTALARFANTIGSLENSTVLLDNFGNLTFINSAAIGNLNICAINDHTISSATNNPIVFSPNGVNEVQANGILSILNGNVLKFYAPGSTPTFGPYFSLSANSSLVSNINLFLPFTAPLAGQALVASSVSQLGWQSIAGVSGSTTVMAVSRFSDTAGTVENSGVIIDNSNNITGATSLNVGSLTLSSNTISSSSASNIIISPLGINELQSKNNLNIQSGNQLKWFNPLNTFFFSLQSPSLTASISMNLPLTAATAGQALVATTPTQLGWASFSAFTGSSTVNAIAKYSNTVGTIQNSGVLIDSSNNITGALSLVAGNVSLATNIVSNTGASNLNITAATGNLLLSSTAGNITLTPAGGQPINCESSVVLRADNPLQFNNSANTQNIQLSAPTALAANYSMILPSTAGAINQLLRVTNVAGTILTLSFSNGTPGYNYLKNGDMGVWQRNTSFTSATTPYNNNNGQYNADAWTIQSDGNNIVNISRVTGPSNTSFDSIYAIRTTVVTASKKWGIAQFLEIGESATFSGDILSFSFAATSTGISNLRAAIIAWSGTPDSVTNPIVSSWNTSGTNPTLNSNWTYISTPSNLSVSGTYARYSIPNITITFGTSNVGVFVWIDDTTASAGNIVDFSSFKLEVGSVVTAFISDPFEVSIARCEFWFQKSIPYSMPLLTVIAAGNVYPGAVAPNIENSIPNTAVYRTIKYNGAMRVAGNPVTYPCTTPANTGRCSLASFVDQAAGSASTATIAPDAKGFVIDNASGALIGAITNLQYVLINWYNDASL